MSVERSRYHGGGRVSRGPRSALAMRVPAEQAEVYRQRADELGIPLSSWVALVLAERENLDIPDYVRDEIKKAQRERAIDETRQEFDMPRSA